MKLATTITLAALAASASAASLCFKDGLCTSVETEGFNCRLDNGKANCAEYVPYVRQQLYDGAGILYADGSDAAREVADRKVRTAQEIDKYLSWNPNPGFWPDIY